jgi:hypothetical protein
LKKNKNKNHNQNHNQNHNKNNNKNHNQNNYENDYLDDKTTDDLLKYSSSDVRLNNTDDNEEIDETRIYKKIDNSKYEIPVEGDIYQSVPNIDPNKLPPMDPRAIIQCPDKLDCSAKKLYDILIEDDFESMNNFNTNCSRSGGTYSQKTNNKDISKDILREKPNFYNDINLHV